MRVYACAGYIKQKSGRSKEVAIFLVINANIEVNVDEITLQNLKRTITFFISRYS